MFRFTLTADSTTVTASSMVSLYADPDSWFLAMALFRVEGSKHLEYKGIKDLIFDWDRLECHTAEGTEAVDTRTIPSSLLELHEVISSSIMLNGTSIGTVHDAVIDESNLHIDAFLLDLKENNSSRIFYLESEWCSWSRNPESHLFLRVPFEQVRRFLE